MRRQLKSDLPVGVVALYGERHRGTGVSFVDVYLALCWVCSELNQDLRLCKRGVLLFVYVHDHKGVLLPWLRPMLSLFLQWLGMNRAE